MENWIGVGIWIVLGAVIGLAMRAVVHHPEEQPGHGTLLMIFGAFGAVIGGMLGVGLFHMREPLAISVGGMAGAVVLSVLLTWLYRWGCRAFV